MPKEWIPNEIKVINFIPIILFFKGFISIDFDNICRKDGSLKVDGIGYIDLTEVDEIVSALEVLDGLFH